MNELKIKGVYKHFKGNYYLVEDIAIDSDTLENIILYRSLQGDGTLWSRTREDFLSEVDHEKYPEVKQKYRFELQNVEKK